MGDETQAVTFSSDQEKADAIDAFDTATGKEEELEAIMEAEIVEKKVEESETEEVETPEPEQKTEEPEKPPEPEKRPEEKPAEPEAPEKTEWGVKKDDLPDDSTGDKYKTPGAVFKAFGEQKGLINRQADHIKAMNEKHEAELAELRTKPAAPVETPKPETPVPDENIADQIKIVQGDWQKEFQEDPYSEKTMAARSKLDDLILKDNQASREAVKQVGSKYDDFAKSQEQIQLETKNRQSLDKDYKEIDGLGTQKEYEDFKLTKASKEVEEDYVLWGNSVATQYYGRRPQNLQEVHHALAALSNKSPDLIQKCELAQIPTLPTEDIAGYLKACEALDYRDGWRTDPTTGKRFQTTRWDAKSQSDIPDRYPTLSAAIEDQRVRSGFYKEQKVEAYDKGSKDALAAASKRDHNELDSEDGTHITDNLTVEQMGQELESLPETPENLKRIEELTDKLELIAKGQRG